MAYSPISKPKIKMQIAKPNGTIIGNLVNINPPSHKLDLNNINEITFDVPYTIIKNNREIRNPLVDKIKSRYLVYAEYDGTKENYVVTNLKNSFSNGEEVLSIQLKSSQYMLRDKKISVWSGVEIDGEYRKDALNMYQVTNDVLSETYWTIDYIDAKFTTKHRSFDFSNTNVLDALNIIANKFGATIVWDTINEKVSFYDADNVGVNKGLRVSYGNLMKSLDVEEMSDEIVTRLKVYGKDGLSIHRLNPLGTSYLEDFSYFMLGFERDENKNTISSSEYMSDELCHALLDFQEVIANNETLFDEYLEEQKTIKGEIAELEAELFDLKTELLQVQDSIDINNSKGLSTVDLVRQETDLLSEIDLITESINSKKLQIKAIESHVAQLKQNISISTTLSPTLQKELDKYIIEETWEDGNYVDDEDLYLDSLEVFSNMIKPKTVITLDIVNFYDILDKKDRGKKLSLGDKFIVQYPNFKLNYEVQLTEFTIDYENHSISITIANTKNLSTDEKINAILANAISTSKTVDMSKYNWVSPNDVRTEVNNIIENFQDGAKTLINAGVNNSVSVNNRGITIVDSEDESRFLRMTNGVIGLTDDGGNTYKTALTPGGVVAERLIGRIMITENLFMENTSGKFRFDQDGVVIEGSSFNIIGGENGIEIDSETGMTVTRSDGNARIQLNAVDGIKFSTKQGVTWRDDLYYDIDSKRLVLNGELNALAIKVGGFDVLTSDNKINGNFIDRIQTHQLTAGYALIGSALIGSLEAEKITAGTLNGMFINGGVINVQTDATIGNSLMLGTYNTSTQKAIMFNGNDAWIYSTGQNLTIDTASINLKGYSIDFNNAYVTGLNVTAKFA